MSFSILTLWQKWNHLDDLISSRMSTFINIRHLSPKEAEEEAKKEFGDEYPTRWQDVILTPIANEICKIGNFDSFSILGPFGIAARVRLEFYKDGSKDPVSDICLEPSLSVSNVNKEVSILSKVDYSVESNEYKPNTVGYLNGLNFGIIPIDNDSTAKEIFEILDVVQTK